jgi:nucleoside-diphosphate-sugar epimerase
LKKILLIAGGTGFIGYHLAKSALNRGFKVISLSQNRPLNKRFLKKVKYIKANIQDFVTLKKKLKIKFDYLINSSGYVDHSKKKIIYQTHYIGCKNLALICLKKKIKHFIQIGSSMEYGKKKSPQKEENYCNPLSFYGKAKLCASRFLLKLYKIYNFPVTIFRLYQVYGPNQDQNRFLPSVINSCAKNEKFPCSNGRQFRDFLYIDDLVDTIFLTFKNPKTKGEIFNVGCGKPLQIRNIINKILDHYKLGKPKFGTIKLRKEEQMRVYPDINKIKKKLNWKPKINFTKGLVKIIKYYNANQ